MKFRPKVNNDVPVKVEPWELPHGWVMAKVHEVGKVQLGRQRAPKYHTGTHMRPYLRVANVFEDRIDLSEVLEMNFTPAEFETYRLVNGDILLNEGQSLELVGRPAMFRDELPGACFQNTLIRFRAYPSVLPPFALYLFRHYLHSHTFRKVATQTVNIAHLSAGRLSQLPFPLPPLYEQRLIVAEIEKQFTRLDAAVAALKRARANLKRYRASVLKAACEGRLVPTEAELARAEGREYEPADRLLARILQARRARWEVDQLGKMKAEGRTPRDETWKDSYPKPVDPDVASSRRMPEGWAIAGIDQVSSHITSGSRDWSKYYGRGTGTFLMAQNVRLGRLDISFRQAVDPPEGDRDRTRSQVQRDDLLETISIQLSGL